MRRYFIMYEYGGVYADLDVESVSPLDDVVRRYPCIIAQEPLIHQLLLYNSSVNFAMPAFMACRPHHPFFKLLIGSLYESISLAWSLPWNDNILHSTGPYYVERILQQYQAAYNNSTSPRKEDYVHVAPWQWFMPDYDHNNLSAFLTRCNTTNTNNTSFSNTSSTKHSSEGTHENKDNGSRTRIARACSVLKGLEGRTGTNRSDREGKSAPPYTRHHWLHTWSSQFTANSTTHVNDCNKNIWIAEIT